MEASPHKAIEAGGIKEFGAFDQFVASDATQLDIDLYLLDSLAHLMRPLASSQYPELMYGVGIEIWLGCHWVAG